jgi:hypothetical protein
MMDFFIPSKAALVIAVITASIYSIPYSKMHKQNLPGAVNAFLAVWSIFGALKVALIAYQIDKCNVEKVGEIEQTYIVIGSFAVI